MTHRPGEPPRSPGTSCVRCSRELPPRGAYSFRPAPSASEAAPLPITKCLRCALLHRPMLRRSLAAAVVVGTVLTALNQGDNLLSGRWDAALYWKIPLTYCVPFIVATYGALTNSRQ